MLLLHILFALLVSVPFSFILVELIDRSIKADYRKLALKYHPDKNKSPDAELQIRQLNEAAEMLGII